MGLLLFAVKQCRYSGSGRESVQFQRHPDRHSQVTSDQFPSLIYVLRRRLLFVTFCILPSTIRGRRWVSRISMRFDSSGSTTAALVALLHRVTEALETNQYVVVLALDFSKAFDTVRHWCTAVLWRRSRSWTCRTMCTTGLSILRRSYCYTVWSAIGTILLSVCLWRCALSLSGLGLVYTA